MVLNNPPKALIVLAALICITVLMITNSVEGEAAVGLLGMIVGYGVGNGIAARNGDIVEPIVAQRHQRGD